MIKEELMLQLKTAGPAGDIFELVTLLNKTANYSAVVMKERDADGLYQIKMNRLVEELMSQSEKDNISTPESSELETLLNKVTETSNVIIGEVKSNGIQKDKKF